MEVAPRIHRIEAPFMGRFVCLYLLTGDRHALLIDTGTDAMPQQVLAPYLKRIGLDPARIRYVLNSHCDFDHVAGNGAVRELCPDAVFMCHALDRAMTEDIEAMIRDRYCEFEADHGISDGDEAKQFVRANSRTIPMDLLLRGGESLRLGEDWWVEVLHTPGHSHGHVSVLDESSRSLILCDATLYNAVLLADGKPAFPPTYRYVDTYVATMERFMGLQVEALLTSHYPVYRGTAVAEFLGESRAFVDRVDAALARELQGGTRTLKELTESLSPRLGEWPETSAPFLAYPLLGHLERMVQYGLAQTGRRDGRLTYRWK